MIWDILYYASWFIVMFLGSAVLRTIIRSESYSEERMSYRYVTPIDVFVGFCIGAIPVLGTIAAIVTLVAWTICPNDGSAWWSRPIFKGDEHG